MSEKIIDVFSRIVIISVLSLVLASSLNIKTVNAQAGQVTLNPTDDTYVDSSVPELNHGNASYIVIGWSNLIETVHTFGWLKFDLSQVPSGAEVDGATLQLYALPWYNEMDNVSAYSSPDNSWTEMTLTYANMPSYNSTPLCTTLVTTSVTSSGLWCNWSVVQAVENNLISNSKEVTIVLSEPSITSSLFGFAFASKEYNTTSEEWSPKLTIYWNSAVPEFTTFIYLPFFMIATLMGVTLYKKKAMLHRRL